MDVTPAVLCDLTRLNADTLVCRRCGAAFALVDRPPAVECGRFAWRPPAEPIVLAESSPEVQAAREAFCAACPDRRTLDRTGEPYCVVLDAGCMGSCASRFRRRLAGLDSPCQRPGWPT